MGEAVRGVLAVVAEKPSMARDIARAVGAREQGDGFFRGNGYVVTWAIGHLVGLAQPDEMRPEWKRWRREALPMLPADWPLVVEEKTASQFQVVRRLMNAPEVDGVVCATDAGREQHVAVAGVQLFRQHRRVAVGPGQHRAQQALRQSASLTQPPVVNWLPAPLPTSRAPALLGARARAEAATEGP